jgi:hypothetical protein
MVVGPLEPCGASVAPLGLAEEALLLELNLVGHALRVGVASVALLSTATAPQLALDLTPNGHGPRLVYHILGLNLVGCALKVGEGVRGAARVADVGIGVSFASIRYERD